MFLAEYGSHTDEQYLSRAGRTRALYIVSLVLGWGGGGGGGGQCIKFRFRKPTVSLALFEMILTYSFQRRSSDW